MLDCRLRDQLCLVTMRGMHEEASGRVYKTRGCVSRRIPRTHLVCASQHVCSICKCTSRTCCMEGEMAGLSSRCG